MAGDASNPMAMAGTDNNQRFNMQSFLYHHDENAPFVPRDGVCMHAGETGFPSLAYKRKSCGIPENHRDTSG